MPIKKNIFKNWKQFGPFQFEKKIGIKIWDPKTFLKSFDFRKQQQDLA